MLKDTVKPNMTGLMELQLESAFLKSKVKVVVLGVAPPVAVGPEAELQL